MGVKFKEMKKLSLTAIAFLQAAGIIAYILLFAFTVQYLGLHFASLQISPFLSMALFLTTFVFSASVCVTIFLGYPAYLFFEGRKRDAARLIIKSIGWLAIFLVLILALLPFSSR
jgi:hypothetical protein